MDLTNEFTVPIPVTRAWDVLTDIEFLAPCLPGARLQEIEGEEYRGEVKVKVGPISARYKGAASFQERDEEAGRFVIRAEGRDTSGQGSASAIITLRMRPQSNSTHVTVDTALTIKGKVAQFGRGMIADISAKLLDQFVECLGGKLENDSASGDVNGKPTVQALAGRTGGASIKEDAGTPPGDHVDSAAAKPSGNRPSAEGDGAEPSSVRIVDSPEPEAVDVGRAAGVLLARGILPYAGIAVVLWLMARQSARRK